MPTHLFRDRFFLRGARCVACALLLLHLGWARGIAVAAPGGDRVDISAAKDKLRGYTDGKGHFVVLIPFDYTGPSFFYGDGSTFYAQRAGGGGRNGDESFNRSFWDPRMKSRDAATFQLRDKKYTLSCGARQTEFRALSDAVSSQLVATAKFHRPLWRYQSYLLARDEKAGYYYVDRLRDPPGNNDFRLFLGPKGALKQQKLTKIVSDAQGDVFSTKLGQLRLVTAASEATWMKGKQRTKLTALPIEDNHVLVYSELGVYTGERLGTPCDDL